VKVVEESAN